MDKPLSHKGFCPAAAQRACCHKAGVKGAEGGEANP